MEPRSPFQEIDALRREIDRAFEEFGLETGPSFRVAFLPGRLARGYPLMNLHEDADNLYVEAMAPGVDPDSLNLTVVRNTLTISGEKKRAPGDIKPEAFHREERAGGEVRADHYAAGRNRRGQGQSRIQGRALAAHLAQGGRGQTEANQRERSLRSKAVSKWEEQTMAEKTVPVSGAPQRKVEPEVTRARERYVRPPVDIYETAEALVLMADLPGVVKESLEVRMEDAVLTIQAKASHAAPGDPIYREYDLNGFFREFELSEEIDQQKVSAELRHGVLTLYLPKKEKAKPRQIEVKVS